MPEHCGSLHLRERLKDEIDRISAYDSHEHFPPEEEYLAAHLDFSSVVSCLGLDLHGCGMSHADVAALTGQDFSEDEKWALFEPHRSRLVNTGFFSGLMTLVRSLYGISGVDRESYREIGSRIRAAQRPGRYAEIQRMAGVSLSLVDSPSVTPTANPYSPEQFGAVYRIDEWMFGSHYRKLGIATAAGAIRAVAECVEDLAKRGVRGIKTAAATMRPLDFQKWSISAVKESFNATVEHECEPLPAPAMAIPFLDSVMFCFVERAVEHGMVIQIHTGMQAYAEGNPYLLRNLVDEFPEAVFDLFHAGYPFSGELAILAKCFPNVYADLCWIPWVSKSLARRILGDWLEIVPNSKIIAFGGDCCFIDMLCGYSRLCRDVVIDVLEENVLAGNLSEDDAVGVARNILSENLRNVLSR